MGRPAARRKRSVSPAADPFRAAAGIRTIPGMTMRPVTLLLACAAALGVASLSVAAYAAARSADPKALPLGDGRISQTAPKKGYVYTCGSHTGGGGAQVNGSWIHGTTWDSTAKVTVDGTVKWPSVRRIVVGAKRNVSGNGLPSHATGTFPVATTDDAYQVDRNPNSIKAQTLAYALPAAPAIAAKPSCIGGGPIGIMLTGSVLFDALDAEGRDAPAHEVQDACGGHPEITGVYHYHSLSPCMDIGTSTTQHSKLVGYAADGFGIYGPRGDGGRVLTTADLDECHGITDTITWNGKQVRMYHYVLTADFPYSVSCYKGTPISTGGGAGGGGAGGAGGPGGASALPGLGGPGGPPPGGPPPGGPGGPPPQA